MSQEIAILGAGMHPWGKWGHNFVEYGVAAAREALKDAGVPWQDVSFVSGGATVRCGYPGYVAGATFAQALGWMVSAGVYADKIDHHPEWSNVYNRVQVHLVTHDLGNVISTLDVALAKQMEKLAMK